MTPTLMKCGCVLFPDGRLMLCPSDAKRFIGLTDGRCQRPGCWRAVPIGNRKYCSQRCADSVANRKRYARKKALKDLAGVSAIPGLGPLIQSGERKRPVTQCESPVAPETAFGSGRVNPQRHDVSAVAVQG